MSNLEDITIAVTSFLRPGYVKQCVAQLGEHLPECRVIVADDSEEKLPTSENYKEYRSPVFLPALEAYGRTKARHVLKWMHLPFDNGLSGKRNMIVRHCKTKYLLLFCDDFKADAECREGVFRMLEVLDQWPEIAVAAGRVDKRPYEARLEYVPGEYIREHKIDMGRGANEPLTCNGRPSWIPVDLAVNYFLAHTKMMRDCLWPEDIRPIGGEHVAFYLDAKTKGYKVVFVYGANVNTMNLGPEAQDSRYPQMRARAHATGHRRMKQHYNIGRYIGMAGDIS